MNKLEDKIYSKSIIDGAVLSVTSTDAYFRTYGKRKEFRLPDLFDIRDLQLEKYPCLKSFLTDNQYLELGYNFSQRLFYVSLYSNREKSDIPYRIKMDYVEGLNFSSIFETLEESLVKEKYIKIQERLQASGCFQICGSPQIKGVYIYEDSQIKHIPETEFSIEDYLKENAYDSLYNAILSGKILEIRYEENQFIFELFYLFRTTHQGPFTRVLEKCILEEKLSTGLEEMERHLNEKICLVRNRIL